MHILDCATFLHEIIDSILCANGEKAKRSAATQPSLQST